MLAKKVQSLTDGRALVGRSSRQRCRTSPASDALRGRHTPRGRERSRRRRSTDVSGRRASKPRSGSGPGTRPTRMTVDVLQDRTRRRARRCTLADAPCTKARARMCVCVCCCRLRTCVPMGADRLSLPQPALHPRRHIAGDSAASLSSVSSSGSSCPFRALLLRCLLTGPSRAHSSVRVPVSWPILVRPRPASSVRRTRCAGRAGARTSAIHRVPLTEPAVRMYVLASSLHTAKHGAQYSPGGSLCHCIASVGAYTQAVDNGSAIHRVCQSLLSI